MKFVIVGLGNIGAEYEMTRHNIGFMVLDRLASQNNTRFAMERYAYWAEIKCRNHWWSWTTLHWNSASSG